MDCPLPDTPDADGLYRCQRGCGFAHRKRVRRSCPIPETPAELAAKLADLKRRIWERWPAAMNCRGLQQIRTEEEIDAILQIVAAHHAYPQGCPDKFQAWISDVIYLDRWREEWGPRRSAG